MSELSLLMLLLPALGWGLLPPVVAKIGGRPSNQIFGTTVGLLAASLVVFAIVRPTIDLKSFVFAALAGAFWVVGQVGQYIGYKNIGVSTTMPISTGMQLIGTSLIGVFIFGEWSTGIEKVAGVSGIVLLIVGIYLTSITDKGSKRDNHQALVRNIIMLLFTAIGYCIYNSIPRGLESSGIAIFLPESIGMVLAALIYLAFSGQFDAVKQKVSWMNMIGGLIFSIAAVSYIFSVRDNGVNTAFIVSQVSVVISTLGGMLVMHENKSRREMVFTLTGLVLIIGGAVVTSIF
ncbi:sugar transporter [Lentilactobacillus parafarraginis]|jgi:glucose uptake protein|uniref:Glucose uptake protein GlcU n=2 Tax=Lentilactobacillus parafarraginis TaxID=390842 RepID=A0A0R1YUG0_9LACO|nr:GRP family sugar transporter [Lentilactobacillus parafarraginis]KRM45509.1 glucose uptake protein GlcU [Lentilactobacillus parafarraginis DSM 18390 = JCM 14109]TLQ19165.1 sugar transporter [Lentilactobacillus parafarraginis]